MNQKGKGRIARLLTLIMLTVFLCGNTVMVSNASTDWPYVDNINIGDRIRGISAGGPTGRYVDYSFYVNGIEYQCEKDNGGVHLNRHYIVERVDVDHVNKTVKVTGEQRIELEIADKTSYKKIGESVTVNLGQEYKAELDKKKDFLKWYVALWRSSSSDNGYIKKCGLEETAAMLGVTQEVVQDKNCTITFTIPDEWKDYTTVYISPAYESNDPTVSGNVPSKPEENKDSSPAKSESSSSGQTTAPESVSGKTVVLSNGTTLASAGAMHNIAAGINGAVVTTPQETMNASAGLSPQDVAAGTNAKLYMGNTYKKAEKTALNDAVSQLGANLMTMVNVDLYTIAKNGTVTAIRTLNGEEGVRVVIGLPAGIAKDGRSFSLVYMDENGKAVEIPDLDNDPRTLTVDLTRFGSFAIVYR